MPIGQTMDVDLARVRLRVFRTTVGYLRVLSISPMRELVGGQTPPPLSRAEAERQIAAMPPLSHGVPTTVVVLSTSGFESAAHTLATRTDSRTIILVEPNVAGGFSGAKDMMGRIAQPGWTTLGLPVSDDLGEGVSYESLRKKAIG